MSKFISSSGASVEVLGSGGLHVAFPVVAIGATSTATNFSRVNVETVRVLREFFAQERCDDMPFRHGDCWVFPLSESCGHRRVLVVDVVGEDCHTYSEGPARSARQAHHQPSLEAAVAWFDAHPEPKPWLDAQTGEVWSISDGYADSLAICRREPDQDSGDDHPYFYGPNFDGIRGDALTAGTRLEVQS